MVNIGDVALAAGVARSTASYAFSGQRSISAEVKARVDAAASELGYTPNAGARALRLSRTHVIGLLGQFLADEFAPAMMQYVQGVCDAAREAGYDVLLVNDEDGTEALARITGSRMVDGVVLLNVAADDRRLPALRHAEQPGVLVGMPKDCDGLDVFDLDFVAAGRLMVDHLADLGHRELVLVSQPEHVVARGGAYVWRLRDGAAAAAAERDVRLHHFFAPASQPGVGQVLQHVLDQHPSVTGLLLNNEAAAAALPSVLHERGGAVPGELSVIGRYSQQFADAFSLPFSSIDSAPGELGRLAVNQLVRRIEHDAGEPHRTQLIPPALIDRGSTRRLA